MRCNQVRDQKVLVERMDEGRRRRTSTLKKRVGGDDEQNREDRAGKESGRLK